MSLSHNAHLSSLSLPDAVAQLLLHPETELDLVASKHFYDFEGDWDEITTAYDDHFTATVKGLSSFLGQPIYRGRWDAPDRSEWESVLPEYADAQELVIWEHDSRRLYCRYSWEDKEIPILIAIGVEGCLPSGATYDGQWD